MYSVCRECGRDEKYALITNGEMISICKYNCTGKFIEPPIIVNTPRCHLCRKAPEDCECPPISIAKLDLKDFDVD